MRYLLEIYVHVTTGENVSVYVRKIYRGQKKKQAKSSIICLLFGSRAPAMGVRMRFFHSRPRKKETKR